MQLDRYLLILLPSTVGKQEKRVEPSQKTNMDYIYTYKIPQIPGVGLIVNIGRPKEFSRCEGEFMLDCWTLLKCIKTKNI